MSNSSLYEAGQLLARLTVLERVVGMMVREAVIKAGKRPHDILAYGEAVKAFFNDRTPEGATDAELSDACGQVLFRDCFGHRKSRQPVTKLRSAPGDPSKGWIGEL